MPLIANSLSSIIVEHLSHLTKIEFWISSHNDVFWCTRRTWYTAQKPICSRVVRTPHLPHLTDCVHNFLNVVATLTVSNLVWIGSGLPDGLPTYPYLILSYLILSYLKSYSQKSDFSDPESDYNIGW